MHPNKWKLTFLVKFKDWNYKYWILFVWYSSMYERRSDHFCMVLLLYVSIDVCFLWNMFVLLYVCVSVCFLLLSVSCTVCLCCCLFVLQFDCCCNLFSVAVCFLLLYVYCSVSFCCCLLVLQVFFCCCMFIWLNVFCTCMFVLLNVSCAECFYCHIMYFDVCFCIFCCMFLLLFVSIVEYVCYIYFCSGWAIMTTLCPLYIVFPFNGIRLAIGRLAIDIFKWLSIKFLQRI